MRLSLLVASPIFADKYSTKKGKGTEKHQAATDEQAGTVMRKDGKKKKKKTTTEHRNRTYALVLNLVGASCLSFWTAQATVSCQRSIYCLTNVRCKLFKHFLFPIFNSFKPPHQPSAGSCTTAHYCANGAVSGHFVRLLCHCHVFHPGKFFFNYLACRGFFRSLVWMGKLGGRTSWGIDFISGPTRCVCVCVVEWARERERELPVANVGVQDRAQRP